MPVGVSFKPAGFRVGETPALKAFKRLDAFDVFAEGAAGEQRVGEVDALRFRFVRFFLNPQIYNIGRLEQRQTVPRRPWPHGVGVHHRWHRPVDDHPSTVRVLPDRIGPQ